MRVLLLEPDAVLATIYTAALEAAGHVVRGCHSAQAAIFAADKFQPQAVILELQLPGHSGVEFLYEYRSYPEWQTIPVIAHTWVPMGGLDLDAPVARQLGITRHLYKPATSLRELVQAVNSTA
ncbi:MAG TPA: response regulator [Verrucomicrobiae bacterium]|nr:response regulator [Verrucomicrobiae bacterium]